MGISGLLPLLKSIHKHCTLKKFAGQTIGVDAYGWLHRGTAACAIELALDKPTTKYVDFAMSRVRMLLDFGVTPYLVFDGDALPSKEGTNQERRKKREESKALGMELYKAGKMSQAHQELQKAAGVTHNMVRQLIDELKKANIQYIVAPYEADAQLTYLEQKGIINGILSEDSDLLVFGAKRLLTKLNQYGECVEIERCDFALCKEISLAGWTDAMFRRMAILSGCDYLPNIDKMGLKTAYRYVRKYKDATKTIKMLQFEGKFIVPADYPTRFQQAELTFLHHRVFCPIEQKMVFFNELERGMKAEDMLYLGMYVDADVVIGVACGDLNPKTKEPLRTKSPHPSMLKENRRATTGSVQTLKTKSSLDNFFKPKRQPLAELDPNSLTPSPSQQRLLEVNRNASWEPRLISSAPQMARRISSIPTTSVGSRPPTNITDRKAFLAKASAISTYQPPKRQRLCSGSQDPSPSALEERSPFFADTAVQPSPLAQKKARLKKAKISNFDVWSDDSVDDILLGLPDVQQPSTPAKAVKKKIFTTLDEPDETILQSSPVQEAATLSQTVGGSSKSSFNEANEAQVATQDSELEPFEDLLESHLRMQRESLMKSFVYQSPSRQEAALRSLSPPAKPCPDLTRTFSAQTAAKQIGALSTLQSSVETVRSTDFKPPAASSEPSRSMTPGIAGSEDALVPDSEDEISERDEDETPQFNLKAYAFVQA